jgi:hypothetical protein
MRGVRGRPGAGAAAAVLLLAGYAVLVAAWIFSNPGYAAPDEWAHFVRAASIGQGQLIGAPPVGDVLGESSANEPGHRERERWARQNTRVVSVPAGRTPPWHGCSLDPAVPAICLNEEHPRSPAAKWATPTGTYQPLPYLLPALVSRVDADPNRLAHAMRAARALLALALLATALLVLWVPGARGLPALGVLVATTPMVLFLVSTLNPSGLEIAAAIAFFACLLRLARGERAPPAVWLALAAAGVALALSRGQAPFWIALHVALFIALVGARPAAVLVRSAHPLSSVALAVVGLGVLLNRLWEGLYGPDLALDPTPLGTALQAGRLELPGVLRQQIGTFNHLEVDLGFYGVGLWFALVVALVSIALLLGTRREQVVLSAAVVAAVAVPFLLVATIMRHTGYGLQGRYVMALSVAVPLLAGEIVYRRRASLPTPRIVLPFAIAAALCQTLALYVNGRRFAVGSTGPELFWGDAVWDPPGGWAPWGVVTLTGAAALVLAASFEARRPPARRPLPPLQALPEGSATPRDPDGAPAEPRAAQRGRG